MVPSWKSRVPPDRRKVMNSVLRKVTFSPGEADEIEKDPEWLVANGLGGYASGTVSGAARRRYHGLLIAALPAPLGRVLMLNGLAEELHLSDGQVVELNAIQSEDRHGADEARTNRRATSSQRRIRHRPKQPNSSLSLGVIPCAY